MKNVFPTVERRCELTDEEKNLLKAAAGELCKTADLAKGFHENAKWLTQQYKTLVAELEGEVRALKSDVEQLEKAMHDYEGLHDEMFALRDSLSKSHAREEELQKGIRDLLRSSALAVAALTASAVIFVLVLTGVVR